MPYPMTIIVAIASTITALGVIVNMFVMVLTRGREWLIKPCFRKLDAEIATVQNNVEKVLELAEIAQRQNKRNEFLLLVNTQPTNIEAIERIHEEMVALNINNYTTDVYNAWHRQFAEPILDERLKK